MEVLNSINSVHNLIVELKKTGKTIGFVPTMGALHQGHISLVEQSIKENDFTIVSIFINPTQFNNSEDLEKYPITTDNDIHLLKTHGADAVYFPKVEDIYPNGLMSEHYQFNGLEMQMEGKFRPGHFDGVATVVRRFFEIIQPLNAYFGEKDFQQLRIVQELVETFHLPIQIVPVPIKREKDGLAMSSRNVRLTESQRNEAPIIYQILLKAKEYLKNHSIEQTKKFVEAQFKNSSFELEYFEIANQESLNPAIEKLESHKLRAFIAVYADEIRLIDNLDLNESEITII